MVLKELNERIAIRGVLSSCQVNSFGIVGPKAQPALWTLSLAVADAILDALVGEDVHTGEDHCVLWQVGVDRAVDALPQIVNHLLKHRVPAGRHQSHLVGLVTSGFGVGFCTSARALGPCNLCNVPGVGVRHKLVSHSEKATALGRLTLEFAETIARFVP